ncbi:lactonase family protein [Lachnospira pectinoschiza]|uniref:6-phosphogluconolactonase n=1 Tax=Lachnospira pectinoschiza TaxID=28052 RepID=A0A1G9U822_9FIRM|nr:lactonase family protein [Lachnospira pectinoschiza]SDM55962.1 6-phosphogluconolactonase [Lachnospira pectinoschiza]
MSKKYVAYVGTYTQEKSKGIHIYDLDVPKGRITERDEIEIDNPSYVTTSYDKQFLYSICDQGVTSFKILEDGSLKKLNTASINGMRGCNIVTTKDNKFLVVAGYHDGKITVLKIKVDGSIGGIADEVFHKGMGSIAERNSRPHVSGVCFTPDEDLLCACDLGIDQIKLYEFDHKTGRIKLYDIIRSQQESAPRQLLFSADGKFAYVVCELKNYINVYEYDKNSDKNRFELIQNIFTVRKDHKSNSAAAYISFTNSGKNLLCSNAGDNTLTVYKVDKKTGKLSALNSLPVSGEYPKFLGIFPDDKHVMCMNNENNTITIFTVDYEKGLIVMNGKPLSISHPNNMEIVELED